MKSKKFVEKEILVLPSNFNEKGVHTCCGNDTVAVSSINRADMQRMAVMISQQEGTSVAEAKRKLGQYYC